MNQPNKVVGTYQRSFLPGISDPKKSQQPPPPSGGQDELRGESPGIPCCRSRVPDLSQLISELELIQLLSRGGSPTPRAQRAVCRRWIDRHAIATLRLGNARFHPRQQVLDALLGAPRRQGLRRAGNPLEGVGAALAAFRMSLESESQL